MSDYPEMTMKRQWNGTYRDISFEIQNFGLHTERDGWTFYLAIQLDRLPENIQKRFWLRARRDKSFPRHVYYDYFKEPLIHDLEWHAGCTWYSKEGGHDKSPRWVKIGCDYQHLWDEGHSYSETWILSDVKRCIDSLWEKIPNMKVRCSYNGGWYRKDEGETAANGSFISFEGKQASAKWDAEHPRKFL